MYIAVFERKQRFNTQLLTREQENNCQLMTAFWYGGTC